MPPPGFFLAGLPVLVTFLAGCCFLADQDLCNSRKSLALPNPNANPAAALTVSAAVWMGAALQSASELVSGKVCATFLAMVTSRELA